MQVAFWMTFWAGWLASFLGSHGRYRDVPKARGKCIVSLWPRVSRTAGSACRGPAGVRGGRAANADAAALGLCFEQGCSKSRRGRVAAREPAGGCCWPGLGPYGHPHERIYCAPGFGGKHMLPHGGHVLPLQSLEGADQASTRSQGLVC